MSEKERISIRLDGEVSSYVYALVNQYGLTVTDILTKFIKIGVENRKELVEALEKKRKLAEDRIKIEETSAEISLEVRKVYLYNNFEKLNNQLKRDLISRKERVKVLSLCLKRIKDVLGEDSWQYEKAKKSIDEESFKVGNKNKEGKA